MSGDIWIVLKDKAIDGFSGATPLAVSAATEMYEKIEVSLAKAGFTMSNLFLGHRPGSIGETSVLLCLIGVLVLILVGIASYRIVIGGIAGVLATGYLMNFLATGQSSPWMHLNPVYHLLMGGFAFGLAFMATEPITAPHADRAKWIYGFCIGALTVLIRVFNPAYMEGVMLSSLFMNVFAPLLDHIEVSFRLKKRIPNV
jgi:Na+-transporting NADH:ubiquinone oxidoreductase subunit B